MVISSFLVLVKFRFVFALEGLLSGLFFVLSFINVFRAVRLLGVSGDLHSSQYNCYNRSDLER